MSYKETIPYAGHIDGADQQHDGVVDIVKELQKLSEELQQLREEHRAYEQSKQHDQH